MILAILTRLFLLFLRYISTVSLKQWGNSLALRIPKDILTSLVVQKDSVMELNVNNGVLIVTPKKDNLLETLVSQISDENLHKEIGHPS